jgi:DnaJ domain
MSAIEGLYKLFQVPPTCTDDELHKAFLDRIFEVHPDRNPDQIEEATHNSQDLISAYGELMDRRAEPTPGANITNKQSGIHFTVEVDGVELDFTIDIIDIGVRSGTDLQDIVNRKSRFRQRWEDLQNNITDPMRALLLVHAAFEAERSESVKNLLLNHRLISMASLLLIRLPSQDEVDVSQGPGESRLVVPAVVVDPTPDVAVERPSQGVQRLVAALVKQPASHRLPDRPEGHVEVWSACQTLIRWADFLWNANRGREAVQILEDAVASGRAQIIEDGVATGRTFPEVIEELRGFHYRWAQYADPTTGIKATPKVRIAHLRRILELGFRFSYIFKFLAEAYHDLGDDEKARAYLSQAWQIDPNLAGAVRIGRALGLSAPRKSDVPTSVSLISPKWTHPQQVPTESQIRQWVNDYRWDTIIEFSNPAEYSRAVLPKARNVLRLITTSLGECNNHKGAAEALFTALDFRLYFDLREAAATSLSKIGDEQMLALMEEFSGRVDEGRSSWSRSSLPYLKNALGYLRARVGNRLSPVPKGEFASLLIYAKSEHDMENYGHARFLLEHLLTDMPEQHPSYLEATMLLARSCAQMNDTKAAVQTIKPVFNDLIKNGGRTAINDVGSWLWSHIVHEEYADIRDDIYKWGLEVELWLTLSATTPDEVLRPLRNLTRWLEILGAGRTVQMIRQLIRTEAPGTLYVDKHDRVAYVGKATLSDSMRRFLIDFDTRIWSAAVAKLKEIMGSPHSISHLGVAES